MVAVGQPGRGRLRRRHDTADVLGSGGDPCRGGGAHRGGHGRWRLQHGGGPGLGGLLPGAAGDRAATAVCEHDEHGGAAVHRAGRGGGVAAGTDRAGRADQPGSTDGPGGRDGGHESHEAGPGTHDGGPGSRVDGPGAGRPPSRRSRHSGRSPWLLTGVFGVAVYVGYFGAAGGIVMLALLTAMITQPLARPNAVKNILGAVTNTVAAAAFALFGHVDWAAVVPLAGGFIGGGWTGPALVRRLPGQVLRVLVAVCGLAVAVRLGISAYA